LIDKHDLVVLVRPAHRRSLRSALARLVGLQRQQPVGDAPMQTREERLRRKQFRLMLVEDNEVNQLVTRGMLSKLGYQVKTVSNGETALALLDQENFDLILMDCMMPEMDGYEAMSLIREQSRFQKLPILALTAKAMKDDRAKCIQAGANDYCSKPIDMAKLTSLLRVWLHK